MDLFQLSDRVEFVHTMMGNWLTWTIQGALQYAPNVLGPWLPLTNAVSPHAIDPSQFPEQYFRVREPAP